MKLLLDQNLSYKLIKDLADLYPKSNHVRLLGLETASDEKVWEYAKQHSLVLVTQDSDFYERSVLLGYPPKVIWIRIGNVSTLSIRNLLRNNIKLINAFSKDKTLGCLQLY